MIGRSRTRKFGQLFFDSADVCKLALALANGKLMFCFWAAIGDDFDVTRSDFADFPVDFKAVPVKTRRELLREIPRLERSMEKAVQFKRNAGKRVGNYSLALCRDVADATDRVFLKVLNAASIWEEIGLYYAQTVRTDFSGLVP